MINVIYPRTPTLFGVAVSILLLLIGLGAMLALALTPNSLSTQSFWQGLDWGRLIYSLKSASIQASLSVFFSILIAIPAAIAVARRPHWQGMSLFIMIISLAMVLPTTVAAMGLLSVWGRNGFLAQICSGFCGDLSIYGLHGVVIANMMLNVPLVMRVMIPLLQAVNPAQWRNTALLGLSPWQRFRFIEFPAIRGVIPGVASLIFMLCFTSFALVLMLGGGPKVTTLEVEIYAAIRFDFDLLSAAGLSLIQFMLMAVVVAITAYWGGFQHSTAIRTATDALPRFDLKIRDQIIDIIMLFVILLLVAIPVVMVAIRGINLDLFVLLQRPQFLAALKASLSVAVITASIVTVLSFIMAYAKAGLSLPHRAAGLKGVGLLRMLLDQGVMLYLVIPSVVLGTSAFIILRGAGDIFGYAFGVVVMANSLLTLPFAYRLLERRLVAILSRHDRLAAQLGILGGNRLRLLTLPALRHDLSLVAGLSAALSLGDLGVIALFANADFNTLPWLLYQLAGKYAADEAAALAFVLMLVTVLLFLSTRFMISRILWRA